MALITVPAPSKSRARLRDLFPGIHLGVHKPGPLNAITDVPGVLVHTQELHSEDGSVNTGVTTILLHKNWFHEAYYAGIFRFNGAGEMTGSHWIEETGLLGSPIVITNTLSVGHAFQGIFEYAVREHANEEGDIDWFILPQVFRQVQHIIKGIEGATDGPVAEGNRGGGTGMICHGLKGGTGTSSRVVDALGVPDADGDPVPKKYTVAALVQANYGRLQSFRIAGVPVGRLSLEEQEKNAAAGNLTTGQAASIQHQKEVDKAKTPRTARPAKRASVGLSRVGGYGHNPSGDLFLAFSTANKISTQVLSTKEKPLTVFQAQVLSVEVTWDATINALMEAAADAAEKAIYNAVCMAETLVGHRGHTVEALDLDQLKGIMGKYL